MSGEWGENTDLAEGEACRFAWTGTRSIAGGCPVPSDKCMHSLHSLSSKL